MGVRTTDKTSSQSLGSFGIKSYTKMSEAALSEKPIQWLGSSFEDLLNFPREARRRAGYQLSRIQGGGEPTDWKPFAQVGASVCEIRIRDENGAYRVMYVAKFEEAIYVLHCFEKKTQMTSKHDKQVTVERYKALSEKRKRR